MDGWATHWPAGWQPAEPQRLEGRDRRRHAAERWPDRLGLTCPPARDPGLPRPELRPLSVLRLAGGICRRYPGVGFALENQTRPIYSPRSSPTARGRHTSSSTSSPTSGTATASRSSAGGHLAERGLRHLRRVAVERARGPRHGPGELRLLVRRVRRRRPVLEVPTGDPAPTTCSTSPSTSAAG